MSMYPNSDHAEPLDLKPGAPAGKSGQPAARPFFENSDHAADDTSLQGGGAPGSFLPSQEPGDAAAEQLPDKIKEIRSAPERELYDAHKQYVNVFQRGTLQDSLAGEDPAVVQQIDNAAAGIYSDMRLSNPEAQQVHSVFCTEVTDEIAADWRSESEAYIKSLGPEGPAKLDAARALVARDPRVFEMLKGPQGDNLTLLKLLIEKAHAEKRDGRL